MRTLLVSMPFGAVDRPALGISLLKAELIAAGHEADVAYPFEHLIHRIGLETYQWLTDGVPYTSFAGDWCFTLPLYQRDSDRDWAYVHDILIREWAMSKSDIARIVTVRNQTPAYLEALLEAYDWSNYDILGFTSTFVQNIASLALAKRLKSAFPHLAIVFGGANWEEAMGEALFAMFPFVDYVCRGEADRSFPALVTTLKTSGDLSAIPGLLFRNGTAPPAKPVPDMDALPMPDMSDYFQMVERNRFQVSPMLLMESSRGCWWGAKHHCTFCGLNGQGMAYRSKSANRVLEEMEALTSSHKCHFISMVDNILDMRYFRDLFPALAKRSNTPTLFYETKANLTREQVRLLARANISTIQPGIESLSDRILKLMRKGTTALRNVQLLKWCAEMSIGVEWNILYGFPSERDADYDAMLGLMEPLSHLQPPSGSGPVRFDRFSPYHSTPEAFGLRNLRPLAVFSHLYPEAIDRLDEIACYFNAEIPRSTASAAKIRALLDAIERWKSKSGGRLQVRDDGTALQINDTRGGDEKSYLLMDYDRVIYLLCDAITSPDKLVADLARLNLGRFARYDIVQLLDRLVDAGLMLELEGCYLALGVYDRFPYQWSHCLQRAIEAQE